MRVIVLLLVVADYMVRGGVTSFTRFLLSRASSDAYEPYMFLTEYSEASLAPGVPTAHTWLLGEIRKRNTCFIPKVQVI